MEDVIASRVKRPSSGADNANWNDEGEWVESVHVLVVFSRSRVSPIFLFTVLHFHPDIQRCQFLTRDLPPQGAASAPTQWQGCQPRRKRRNDHGDDTVQKVEAVHWTNRLGSLPRFVNLTYR
jgi:hypothetical protein